MSVLKGKECFVRVYKLEIWFSFESGVWREIYMSRLCELRFGGGLGK